MLSSNIYERLSEYRDLLEITPSFMTGKTSPRRGLQPKKIKLILHRLFRLKPVNFVVKEPCPACCRQALTAGKLKTANYREVKQKMR